MDIQKVTKKTNLVVGIITALSAVVAAVFLFLPKPSLIFGLIVVICCSGSVGFSLGTGYSELLAKKEVKHEKH